MTVSPFYWILFTIFYNINILANSLENERQINPNSRERCIDKMDDELKERNPNAQFDSYSYQPRTRYDFLEKHPNNRYDAYKRSLANAAKETAAAEEDPEYEGIQKRQVGVVYGNGKPIGILEPYEQSYKFIPVKEEAIGNSGIGKREANLEAYSKLQDDYPTILANFKINSRINRARLPHQKREIPNGHLKSRRSKYSNGKKIDEKLSSILDDMGLVDEEDHGGKRDVDEQNQQQIVDGRKKRNQPAKEVAQSPGEEKKDGDIRRKRDKDEGDLIKNFEESGDISVSGNRSPLVASSEIDSHSAVDDEDEEKRMERQIKEKISSLREEVKREIGALKNNEEIQRKKRQITLLDKENDSLDPVSVQNADELKPLIRKRRQLEANIIEKKKHKGLKKSSNHRNKRQEMRLEEDDLFDEDLETKREVDDNDYEEDNSSYDRNKRSQSVPSETDDFYDYFDEENARPKRRDFYFDYGHKVIPYANSYGKSKIRSRRRVEESLEPMNRPQQLNDMSESDLFGALPKNYDGELSRYKRVKRNKIK